MNLCNDVIHTAIDVVNSLPPLSLANESKIPPMGLDCLAQVTTFLKGVTMPNSGADILGRRLASELLLGLASQRGSLRYLLEWVEMALAASAVVSTMAESRASNQEGLIGYDCFMSILMQMRRSLVGQRWCPLKLGPVFQGFLEHKQFVVCCLLLLTDLQTLTGFSRLFSRVPLQTAANGESPRGPPKDSARCTRPRSVFSKR